MSIRRFYLEGRLSLAFYKAVPDETPRQNPSSANEETASRSNTVPFPKKGSRRTPRIHDFLDRVSGVLILFSVIFAPWAFGSTVDWAVEWLTYLGFALGGLLLAKHVVRLRAKYRPHYWGISEADSSKALRGSRWLRRASIALIGFILLQTLVAAVNKRAVIDTSDGAPVFFDAIKYLPRSFDAAETWRLLWVYVGLAATYFAIRDWLLTKTPSERQFFRDTTRTRHAPPPLQGAHLPQRLTRLLWTLSFSAAALSLISILQRLDGTDKLLWILQPKIPTPASAQLGPYNYRSNGAQYLNLAWPVIIGFWWFRNRLETERNATAPRIGQDASIILLPLAIITVLGPLLSLSRGGAGVAMAGALAVATIIVMAGNQQNPKRKWLGFGALLGVALIAGYIGGRPLYERIAAPDTGYSIQRDDPGLNDFSVVTRFTPPGEEFSGHLYLPGLSPLSSKLFTRQALVIRISNSGDLQAFIYGRARQDARRWIVRDFESQYVGQTITLSVTRRAGELSIYVDGVELESETHHTPNAPDADLPVVGRFVLHTPTLLGQAPAQTPIAERTRVYDVAIDPAQVDTDSQPKPIFDYDFKNKEISGGARRRLSGREDIYRVAREMAADYPIFGMGAGAYGAMNQLYLENPGETWAAYVHDDYLEARINFGWVGFGAFLALVATQFLHWFVGSGIRVYWPFVACLWIASFTCLAHAKYDFPFQIHSITFAFVTLMAILSSVSRR